HQAELVRSGPEVRGDRDALHRAGRLAGRGEPGPRRAAHGPSPRPEPPARQGAMQATGPDDCGVTQPRFVRGEANGDGLLDISDGISGLNYLFSGGVTNCEDAIDSDDDGTLTITDPIRLLD